MNFIGFCIPNGIASQLPLFIAMLTAFSGLTCGAQSVPTTDIEYAKAGDQPLKLDLYLSAVRGQPLLVYVHGGAWRGGSRANPPILALRDRGYAIASVDYRLSTEAIFPAQIHDIQA